MNDRCTPATARRLKELGFEQPVPASGQVWYLDDEAAIVLAVHSNGVSYCRGNCNYFERTDIFLSLFVYAPTAPDILRELGSGFALTIHPEAIGGNCFCMQFMTAAITTVRVHAEWQHENPAEACAEAWVAKQKP